MLLTIAAAGILHFLKKSSDFTRKFVYDCLPKECRENPFREINMDMSLAQLAGVMKNIGKEVKFFGAGLVPVVGSDMQAWGTKESVEEAVEKGKRLVAETMKTTVNIVR